jgi:hypothetical protein
MDLGQLHVVTRRQAGVISRQQVLDSGGADNDVRRMVRRRELRRVHPSVFVDHTGPLSWEQRAWAAVLSCAPSARAGPSALRAHGLLGHGGGDRDPIQVVVASDRRVVAPPTVRVTRGTHFETETQPHLSPPRQRLETAVIWVAARAEALDSAVAVAADADAVQAGRTTVPRLRAALPARRSGGSLTVLGVILDDITAGACSALERRTYVSSSALTAFPAVLARDASERAARSTIAMSSTSACAPSWSWTAASDTTGTPTAGPTSTAIWPTPWRISSRCERDGRRCWTPAASPGSWAGCRRRVGGRVRSAPALHPAEPLAELPSHRMTGILH